MNNRRKLVIVLGAATFAVPLRSFAQKKGKVWRIGFLTTRARPAVLDTEYVGTFRQGLRELGYVEGQNVEFEWRFSAGKYEVLPKMAAELVQRKVDVIVTTGTPATRAAQQATKTIPIVMVGTGDPIGSGFISSLRRPGGNITGLTNINTEINGKRAQMLVSLLPKPSQIAFMLNPTNPTYAANLASIQVATEKLGVRLLTLEVRRPEDIELAFSTISKQRAEALIVQTDRFLTSQHRQIVELSQKARLPTIYGNRKPVEAGGLMSYSTLESETMRRAANYVDKTLKGAKPGELPVEQPTRLELAINLKAAKALGLTIPPEIMVQATRVIE
jgi:putative ABC transport system substrate-binding protein